MNLISPTLVALLAFGALEGATPKPSVQSIIKINPVPPTIQSFTASSPTALPGQSVSLTAMFSGRGGIGTVYGSIEHPDGTNESWSHGIQSGIPLPTPPLAGRATFALDVSNPFGEVKSCCLQVDVNPVINSFWARPADITTGSPVTLAFELSGGKPTLVSLSSGPSAPFISVHTPPEPGELTFRPTRSTQYTLRVENAAGRMEKSLQVTVVPAPRITSFFADPSRVNPGEGSTLYGGYSDGTATLRRSDAEDAVPWTGPVLAVPAVAGTTGFGLRVTNSLGTYVEQVAVVYAARWRAPKGQPVVGRTGGHRMTRLADGRVLITGGGSLQGVQDTAEIYDPVTETFVLTGRMNQPRRDHTSTLLNTGKVLISGGGDALGNPSSTAELFDPATGRFTPTFTGMNAPRVHHTATFVPYHASGVLLLGGTHAEIYATDYDEFWPVGDPFPERKNHTATSLVDASGQPAMRALVVGGDGAGSDAELFDFATWKGQHLTNQPSALRSRHCAVLLSNGKVLLAGGFDSSGNPLRNLEIYDPSNQSFSPAGSLINLSGAVEGTLLPDGTVLFTHPEQPWAEYRLPDGTQSVRSALGPDGVTRGTVIVLNQGAALLVGVDPLRGQASARLYE